MGNLIEAQGEDRVKEGWEIVRLLAKCIASTPPEYHAELCRDFRIPPSLVHQQYERS